MVKFAIKKICSKCHKPWEETETPTEKYPLVGFWKHNASDHFGYEITSVENGRYRVMFKGPGGGSECPQEEMQRYETSIHEDKRFQLQDYNNMKIKGIFTCKPIKRYKNRCSEELEIYLPK